MIASSTDPRLSVIVVCLNNARVLERCLAAVTAQSESTDVEVLAVGRWVDKPDKTRLRERFSKVHWIDAPKEDTVPLMRTRGISASRGAIIALLEDDCVLADGWCQGVIDAHQASSDAIGGAIEPSDDYKNLDWAVYFCEYARFMAPFAGAVSALPGNNVSYKRAVVSDLVKSEGLYDVFFHWQLQQSGEILVADPRLIVYNANHWSLAHVTTSPF
ncbi:MAG: glycosyltransferase, partial [Chloroflexota bacterium]|nr:glycosyltransferase [Chloroflexota bacterium]